MKFPAEDEKDPHLRVTAVYALIIVTVCVLMIVTLLNLGGRRATDFIPPDSAPLYRDTALIGQTLAEGLKENLDNGITAVHFFLPDCPCETLSSAHMRDLHHKRPQLNYVIAVPRTTPDDSFSIVQTRYPAATVIRSPVDIPSAPAILLSDIDGTIRYFGAYGRGAGCVLPDPEYFIHYTDRMATASSPAPFFNTAVSGCFCSWPGNPAR